MHEVRIRGLIFRFEVLAALAGAASLPNRRLNSLETPCTRTECRAVVRIADFSHPKNFQIVYEQIFCF